MYQNAKDYFKYFLEKKIEIYLSSIVVAEYSVKDGQANLPLEFVKTIPFDFFYGKTAGEFYCIPSLRTQATMQHSQKNGRKPSVMK